MKDIVEMLRGVGYDYDFHENSLVHAAVEEIESLRAQLAEAQAEVQEQARLNGMGSEREAKLLAQLAEVTRERDDYKQAVYDLGLTPEEARAGAKRSRDMKQQLLATQAQLVELQEENARLREDAERLKELIARQQFIEDRYEEMVLSARRCLRYYGVNDGLFDASMRAMDFLIRRHATEIDEMEEKEQK